MRNGKGISCYCIYHPPQGVLIHHKQPMTNLTIRPVSNNWSGGQSPQISAGHPHRNSFYALHGLAGNKEVRGTDS